MKSSRAQPPADAAGFVESVIPFAPAAGDRPFRVLLAYDDVPAGHRALQNMAQRLGHERGEPHVTPSFWSFSMLDDPAQRAAARADAALADLVICAVSQAERIPAAIDDLVSAALSSRHGRPGEILALFGNDEAWTISHQGAGISAASAAA